MYIFILSLLTILALYFQHIYIALPIIFACIPVFTLISKSRNRKIMLYIIAAFILLVLLFAALFRFLRDSLPPPEISHNKIVGYVHYFGYPLYLDTFVFFIFLLFPIVGFYIFRHRK